MNPVTQIGAEDLREQARRDPEGWWAAEAGRLDWDRPWDTVLDESGAPFYRWFEGGRLNASFNCLDRHVLAGRGDRVAFHWCGEEGETRAVTYASLLADVSRLANALKAQGIGAGDVVGIYLPMIPEVVVAMLACARIGAPHNVVFGGFSAESAAERMQACGARALITADGLRRKGRTAPMKAAVDEAMDAVASLETVVVVRHTGAECPMRPGRDVFYDEALAGAPAHCTPVSVEAEHPLFLLYSSGSTAKPKGIVHATAGYLVGVASTFATVFAPTDDDVYWCTADIGWITGHSYVVYGPLMAGVTSVMFEGAPDHPHTGVWWEICERHGVSLFYTAPTAIRACMRWGRSVPESYDLSALRLLGTCGEPINPAAWEWYHEVIGGGRCPIADTWWQTETGHIMITTLSGEATKPGSAGRPMPGVFAEVVDTDGLPIEEGRGLLVLTRPWPGMLRGLHGDRARYVDTYWSRFGPRTYVVGDACRVDEDGDLWIIGRVDDVINVSGHRLSTAEVESALVAHPLVAEAAVVAEPDELTGQAILAYVTLADGATASDALQAELRELVAARIGKLARPKRIVWAQDLPKTRSGKIMRRLLRDLAEGRELGDVTTLRDPAVLDALRAKVG